MEPGGHVLSRMWAMSSSDAAACQDAPLRDRFGSARLGVIATPSDDTPRCGSMFAVTTLRMQLQPVLRCSSLNALDPGSGR